jgi:hypothetical protein
MVCRSLLCEALYLPRNGRFSLRFGEDFLKILFFSFLNLYPYNFVNSGVQTILRAYPCAIRAMLCFVYMGINTEVDDDKDGPCYLPLAITSSRQHHSDKAPSLAAHLSNFKLSLFGTEITEYSTIYETQPLFQHRLSANHRIGRSAPTIQLEAYIIFSSAVSIYYSESTMCPRLHHPVGSSR